MQDAKEEIRARLAIEDVVGQYIELKRAGRNLKGKSPWGVDKTPSFMVSPEKGIWHDFSANKGGDVFSFVMEVEGITFREALEKLANQAGVQLEKYSGGDAKISAHKKRLKECLALASKYFQFAMTKNRSVCEYVFYKRNLTRTTISDFKIGYAPTSGRALRDFLIKKGFSERELEYSGLLNRFGGDLFKGRMMVPLMDTIGEVIGFTGRILDSKDKNSPKYLNTPETFLYNKGRHIFGFSQAKEAIRKSGFAVIVEGNMDVISSHQAGVREAVATAGTAMTEMHLKAIHKLTDDIRLAYDGDDAGVAAAERAIGIASKIGLNLSVISDYHGAKDPDELIQKSAELWQKAVADCVPAIDWLLEKYEIRLDLSTARGKKEYSTIAGKLLADISDPVEREHYEKIISEKLDISTSALRQKEKLNVSPRRLKSIKSDKKDQEIDSSAPSIAEKNLAAIAKFGNLPVDKEYISDKLNDNELSLIYEVRYAKWDKTTLALEVSELTQKIYDEKIQKQKDTLTRDLVSAEGKGDDDEAERIIKEIDKLNRTVRK